MKGILLVCLAIATAYASDDLPTFSWDENTLVVEYANGDVDMAEMINVLEEETDDEEDDTCIMFGTFETEDIPVALTGCPGETTFDVVFDSENTADSVFEVRDGVVTPVAEEEPGVGVDDEDANTVHATDADRIIHVEDPEIRKLLERSDVEDRAIPTKFEINLSLRYDNLFLQNVAGGDHAKAKTKVHSVVNLARPYFKWASLGNEVSLKILDVSYVNENLQLAGNPGGTLSYAESLTAKEGGEADNWHYFSYDTQAGTAGIARSMSFGGGKGSGSFCLGADYKKRRTAISEWMQSDAKTSLTFAHELGHAMGMPHDFCSDSSCTQTTARNYGRPDSSGNACWGNSIMDYYQPTVNKWSTCSREQVAVWANDVVKIFGKHCKDTSAPKCEDLCPGSRCTISAPTLCQNPSTYGGCNGQYKSYFDKLCRKSCKICTGGSTAPAATTAKPAAPSASCKDTCPGTNCNMTPTTLCQNPSLYGGCSGMYSSYFDLYCKKSCGKC